MSEKKYEMQPIDSRKPSPGYSTIISKKYWQTNITNNKLVNLRQRNGIAKKIITKIKQEMFKYSFFTSNNTAESLRKSYNMDSISAYAWDCASTSGYSLIYVHYSDVLELSDYAKEHTGNDKPVYFYVIPRAWINQDAVRDNQDTDRDYYEIYRSSGNILKIHTSRIIRVANNPEENSMFLPAYNALDVADNILWSVGQTIFRAGQGFPHLKVNNPGTVTDETGSQVNEVEYLQKTGALRDINAMTAFISDGRYVLDFLGAEGKAIKPAEYWEICLDILAMSTDIPKDILRGISAGALTGSEVNLKEYYSTIRSIQVQQLEPIYNAMFERLGVYNVYYEWENVFEQDQKEQAETVKIYSDAFGVLVEKNILSQEESRKILKDMFEFEIVEGNIPDNKTTSQTSLFSADNHSHDHKKTDIQKMKEMYNIPSWQMDALFVKAMDEDSTLPKPIQQSEKKYMKAMIDKFRETRQKTETILENLNV